MHLIPVPVDLEPFQEWPHAWEIMFSWLTSPEFLVVFGIYMVYSELKDIRKVLNRLNESALLIHKDLHVNLSPENAALEPKPRKTDLDLFCEARAHRIRIDMEGVEPNGIFYVTSDTERTTASQTTGILGRSDITIVVDPHKSRMPALAEDYRLWLERKENT